MKKSCYLFLILLLTGCASPVYETVTDRRFPARTESTILCMDNCNNYQNVCSQDCQQYYEVCLIDQKETAEKNFSIDLLQYNVDLANYNTKLTKYNIEKSEYEDQFSHLQSRISQAKRYCNQKGIKDCKQARYYTIQWLALTSPKKPQEPQPISLHSQITKYQSSCKKDCECDRLFDQCFLGCGGQIQERSVCVRNCQ